MLCDQGKTLRLKDYRKRPVSSGTDEAPDAQRYTLAENESTRLFFSVGRSRRVFPREILGIINTKTTTPRKDIGAIRILDNYSFVQVRDSVAGKIIEALNGMNFRSRPLTVNYAKSNEGLTPSGSSLTRSCPCKHGHDLAPFVNKDEDMTLTAASEQNLYDSKKEDDI